MSNFNMMPTYDPESVQPMRDELTVVGFEELLTEEDVDRVFQGEGTTLLLVNSVCGCAAGNARPGAMLALQNEKIPDNITTVFAGQDKAAAAKARGYLTDYPPSSPCIALVKDRQVLGIMERHHIENLSAQQVAGTLVEWFSEHCSQQGPSIPREKFEEVVPHQACGSTIPLTGS